MGHSVVIRKNIRRRFSDAYVYAMSIVLAKAIVKRLNDDFEKNFSENRKLPLLVVKNKISVKILVESAKIITIYLPFY